VEGVKASTLWDREKIALHALREGKYAHTNCNGTPGGRACSPEGCTIHCQSTSQTSVAYARLEQNGCCAVTVCRFRPRFQEGARAEHSTLAITPPSPPTSGEPNGPPHRSGTASDGRRRAGRRGGGGRDGRGSVYKRPRPTEAAVLPREGGQAGSVQRSKLPAGVRPLPNLRRDEDVQLQIAVPDSACAAALRDAVRRRPF
jgi:hypothetical protein